MTFPLVLFDLDGTLIDSAADIAAALNAAFAEAGQPALPPAVVVGYVGDGATKLVERAAEPGTTPDDISDLVSRFRRHYAEKICVDTRPYPGVVELLQRLDRDGVRMAVVTNKPGHLARQLLGSLGLDGFFADVIGDGDGFPRKPSPDAARYLLSRHGVAAPAALLVGDGLPDVRLGRAAGCPVAAATWGYTPSAVLAAEGPDFMIHQPAELLGLRPVTPGR
jgi:phosphoglycolate phosphatase